MAFKKFDFSTLDTEVRERDPYELHDGDLRREFAGQDLRRGPVTVGLDHRTLTIGLDDIVVPVTANGKRFDLVFKGQRAADYRACVHEPLTRKRFEMLDAKDASDLTEADFEIADAVTTDIIVEGYWKKRWWKHRGEWHFSYEMHVAKFHYQPDPSSETFAEMGRIPEAA